MVGTLLLAAALALDRGFLCQAGRKEGRTRSMSLKRDVMELIELKTSNRWNVPAMSGTINHNQSAL